MEPFGGCGSLQSANEPETNLRNEVDNRRPCFFWILNGLNESQKCSHSHRWTIKDLPCQVLSDIGPDVRVYQTAFEDDRRRWRRRPREHSVCLICRGSQRDTEHEGDLFALFGFV